MTEEVNEIYLSEALLFCINESRIMEFDSLVKKHELAHMMEGYTKKHEFDPYPSDGYLHYILKNRGLDAVAMFMLNEYDIDVNKPYSSGETPLHLAVQMENVGIVRALLHKGSNVNAVDGHGNTPLQLAVKSMMVEIIQVLIDENADVTVLDDDIIEDLVDIHRHRNIRSQRHDERQSLPRYFGTIAILIENGFKIDDVIVDDPIGKGNNVEYHAFEYFIEYHNGSTYACFEIMVKLARAMAAAKIDMSPVHSMAKEFFDSLHYMKYISAVSAAKNA